MADPPSSLGSVGFFGNPLIRREALEPREYQEKIATRCLSGNTLVCLPTGLGKSIVAALVAAERMRKKPDSKVVVLAPTKPLVAQHERMFLKFLNLKPESYTTITGEIAPERRRESWNASLVFSTPQVFMNDLMTSQVDLAGISLIVFDEAHRAVGDYAYTFIAERYAKHPSSLILGLTASPGSTKEAVQEVCKNLFIEQVEARSLQSADVKPYIGGIRVEWVSVQLPEVFREAKRYLEVFVLAHLKSARDYGYLESADADRVRMREVLAACEKARVELGSESAPKDILRRMILELYSTIHALRAIELLETQGFAQLVSNFDSLRERLKKRSTASLRMFLNDESVARAERIARRESEAGRDHPKMGVLVSRVKQAFANGARRIIVFTNYRASAAKLVETLNTTEGVSAVRLVGQVTKGKDKGLSQKEQTMLLEDFRAGEYNVLVATQIGEEGLDIVECDEVIFYDAVPSAIRYVQRRGRTGRKGPGRATVLFAAGTRDEAYYYIARRRERVMAEAIREFAKEAKQDAEHEQQPKLEEFWKRAMQTPHEGRVVIVVDSRDLSSPTARELKRLEVEIVAETLPVGDYVLSDRVAVERKTIDDFASSIIDGRLFEQVTNLKNAYQLPIVVVEGESFRASRDIRPEALMGAIASVLVDFGVPLISMRSPEETALLLQAIARREQIQEKRELRIRMDKKPTSLAEQQEFLVAGLPLVDRVLAKRLLKALGTPEKVFMAKDPELQTVWGIGKKIAERIRNVLTGAYHEDKREEG